MVHKQNTFWQLFRLTFVIFSLYLTGDALYRWDGISFYASFYEFLPSVALAFIIWSLVAALAAIVLWLFFRTLITVFRIVGLKIDFEHLLLYMVVFIFSGVLIWKGKRIIWPYEQTSLQLKFIVVISLALISGYMIWLFRGKIGKAAVVIQERLTPLVWVYSFLIICSIPLVGYYAVWETGKTKLSINTKSSVTTDGRPNIILVTFDALAARHMTVYGYERETTPFIEKWSKKATVFSKAEAACNFTTPSAASLMTGKRVWTHQTYHIEGMKPIRSDVESMPHILKDNGYFNIAFVVNPFASVRVLGMSDSFDLAPLTSEFGDSASLFGWKFGVVDKMLYQAFGDKIRFHNWILSNEFIFSKFLNLISRNVNLTEVPPEKAFNKLLEIMDHNIPRPFFAWIHIFPPHDPYLSPENFKGKFNTSSELRNYKQQEKLVEESYKYLFQYKPYSDGMRPAVNLMKDYYDEFITYIDKQFEDFIEELNKRETGNTVFILTADHGESFEHGYFTHGGPFLYEQVTHIPLVIKKADQDTGQIVSGTVEQVDIPATILDLANIQLPIWMEGRSLLPLMRGKKLPPKPAFSMNFEGNPSRGHAIAKGSIAVWDGDYKLIHYLERNESLLFNLTQDPDELSNLIEEEPEIGQYLLRLIRDNLQEANKRMGNGTSFNSSIVK